MQYISPLFLLETLDAQQPAKSILLARKKTLAELELNDGRPITINGRELTRHDIIKLFDELQRPGNLAWHVAIAEDKVLTGFLENTVLEKDARFANGVLYKNEIFIDWVSPYYFTSFAQFAEVCLKTQHEEEWRTLLANPLLMNATYVAKAWIVIEELVRINLAALNMLVHERQPGNEPASDKNLIEQLAGNTYTLMLQALPEKRFTHLRDEYGNAVMQCAIFVYNEIDKVQGIEMIERAITLVCSADVRQKMEKKRNEMLRLKRSKYSWWLVAFGAFLLLLLILRTIAFKKDKENWFNNAPVYYMDSSKTERQKDSSMRIRSENSGDTVTAPGSNPAKK